MTAATLTSFFEYRASRKHRAGVLAFIILAHILLFLLFLHFAPMPQDGRKGRLPLVVELIPTPHQTQEASRTRTRTQHQAKHEQARKTVQPQAKPPAAPTAPQQPSIWSQVIPLTHGELANLDQKMATSPPSQQEMASNDQGGAPGRGVTDDSDGPGSGPNGETLYNARWYREPTNAELDFYLPKGRRVSGWGMIACRTVSGYRVEDCHELGQSPGSGLASAVRQASWQFRVLPPRIGGRPMIGAWVRIRIDYRVVEKDAPAG